MKPGVEAQPYLYLPLLQARPAALAQARRLSFLKRYVRIELRHASALLETSLLLVGYAHPARLVNIVMVRPLLPIAPLDTIVQQVVLRCPALLEHILRWLRHRVLAALLEHILLRAQHLVRNVLLEHILPRARGCVQTALLVRMARRLVLHPVLYAKNENILM